MNEGIAPLLLKKLVIQKMAGLESGLTLDAVWHVAPGRPEEPETLYLGAAPGVLFRSDDRGEGAPILHGLIIVPVWADGPASAADLAKADLPFARRRHRPPPPAPHDLRSVGEMANALANRLRRLDAIREAARPIRVIS